MKNFIVKVLSVLLITVYAYGENSSQRIGGISDFLIERANDNYLYIFENNIKKNETFRCYFSNTRENLEFIGLKELMISKELWATSLKKDLDTLLTRSSAAYIENTFQFSKKSSTLWGSYMDMLKYIEIELNGEFHPLNQLPLNATPDLRVLVNSFYTTALNINDTLEYFGKFTGNKLCNTPVVGSKEFLEKINSVYKLDESVKKIVDIFKKYNNKKRLRVTANAPSELKNDLIATMNSKLTNLVDQNKEAIRDIKSFVDLLKTFENQNTSMTVKVISALKVIRAKSKIQKSEFKKLKKYVTFFAQVSEASSDEEVSTILKTYSIPAVSFFEKRNNSGKWLINSYLGVAAGDSNKPAGETDGNSYGVYAPIGLEYSHTINDGASLSYMVAPFDFAYPINLKLNGIDEEIETNEVIAPSIGITYGFADSPLAIGLIYQKGKKFASSGEQEKRLFIHLSFDMPLFILK